MAEGSDFCYAEETGCLMHNEQKSLCLGQKGFSPCLLVWHDQWQMEGAAPKEGKTVKKSVPLRKKKDSPHSTG